MPEVAYLYAIPYQLYRRYKIRRYGFHGTSHRYVAYRYRKLTGKQREETNIITVHLGNGCSACAIKGGKSVDTSMGLTPLEGLVMGTRSGDIDPSVLEFLHHKEGMSVDEISRRSTSSPACSASRGSPTTCATSRSEAESTRTAARGSPSTSSASA